MFLPEDLKGRLPLVAEDLGVITNEVEELRDKFNLPGMKILQFAFDGESNNPYLPKNIQALKILREVVTNPKDSEGL